MLDVNKNNTVARKWTYLFWEINNDANYIDVYLANDQGLIKPWSSVFEFYTLGSYALYKNLKRAGMV